MPELQDAAVTPPPEPARAAAYAPILLGAAPDPALTVESWVPFQANALALGLVRRLVSEPASAPSCCPILLFAPPGLGKTHLLHAIANAVPRARLVHLADWRVEQEHAARLGARADLRRWLIESDLLLLDDVDLCPDDDDLQRELLALLDGFSSGAKALVASSRSRPAQLTGLNSALRSRLSGALLCELQMGGLEERIALLERLFGAAAVPAEVLQLLASRATDNVRQLRAVARQTLALHECLGLPIDLALARSIFPDAEQPEAVDAGAGAQAGTGEVETEVGADEASREHLKQMLASASNEGEQALALEIALTERLRQLRERRRASPSIGRLEKALDLLRRGRTAEALKCIAL